jgi:hypothetical protein
VTARDRLTAMYVPTSDADETEWEQRLNAVRAEVLREAGTVADELIARLDRTGDDDAFTKADAYRAYSDRLHEIADTGPAPAAGQDDTGTADDGDRIVAHRAQHRAILCRTCCHGGAAFTPVISNDLIDGGMCANCGNDVLIDPPTPADGYAGTRGEPGPVNQ